MSVKEAVFWLLDFAGYRRIENPVKQPLVHQVSQKQAEERKPFVLPEPAGDNSYLISYLNQERGISRAVIDLFLKDGLIYKGKLERAEYGFRTSSTRYSAEERFVRLTNYLKEHSIGMCCFL